MLGSVGAGLGRSPPLRSAEPTGAGTGNLSDLYFPVFKGVWPLPHGLVLRLS